MTISFEVVTDDDGFQKLEAAWRELFDLLDPPHFFQDFDWCRQAWLCVSSKAGRRLRILVGRLEGRVVLIWPLMIAGPFLRVLGSDLFEFHDVLVRPEPDASAWLEAAFHAARRLGGAALLLRSVRHDADIAEFLGQHKAIGRSRVAGRAWSIQLDRYDDWDSYIATLPHGLQVNQRKQWRRVAKLPSPTRFEILEHYEDQLEFVRWLHTAKTAWLDARDDAGSGMFGWDSYRDFLTSIVAALSRRNMVMACRLVSGDEIMAGVLGFRHRDYFVFFIFVYGEKWATFSPGRLLMAKTIEWCMQNNIRTFDMLLGEEDYKLTWSDTELEIFDHFIPLTLEGRAIAAWHSSGLSRRFPWSWAGRISSVVPARLRRAIADRFTSHADLIADMRLR